MGIYEKVSDFTIGYFVMNHNSAHSTNGQCSIASLHTSVCPDSVLPVAQHYISMYQSFTDGIVSSVITEVSMVFLLFAVIAYAFLGRYVVLLNALLLVVSLRLHRNFNANLYRPQAIIRWLSLLINSPSLILFVFNRS